MIISEQMKKLTATLKGIQSLSSEERKAMQRLSKLIAAEEGGSKSPISNNKVDTIVCFSHCY